MTACLAIAVWIGSISSGSYMGVDPSADTTQSSNKISRVLMKMQNNQWWDVKTSAGESLTRKHWKQRKSEAGVERSWLLICSFRWRHKAVEGGWGSWVGVSGIPTLYSSNPEDYDRQEKQVSNSNPGERVTKRSWVLTMDAVSRVRSCGRVTWWLDEIAVGHEIKKQEVTRPGYHHGDLVKNWWQCWS